MKNKTINDAIELLQADALNCLGIGCDVCPLNTKLQSNNTSICATLTEINITLSQQMDVPEVVYKDPEEKFYE